MAHIYKKEPKKYTAIVYMLRMTIRILNAASPGFSAPLAEEEVKDFLINRFHFLPKPKPGADI
jgi:hypothetical protein